MIAVEKPWPREYSIPTLQILFLGSDNNLATFLALFLVNFNISYSGSKLIMERFLKVTLVNSLRSW
jgi:hypothetical protein